MANMTLEAWSVLARLLGYEIRTDHLGYFAYERQEIHGFWCAEKCYLRVNDKLIRIHGYPDYKRPEDR